MYRSGTGSPLQAFMCGLQGVNWASRVNVPRVIAIISTVTTAIGRRFQLFSPSPERNGRRSKVSGVTGDVIDMGLLQFQLREVDVENGRYTGHVATFSNSLVFVSPATGLLRFDSAPERSLQATSSNHLRYATFEPR